MSLGLVITAISLVITLLILTFVEALLLRSLEYAESPKNVAYPILANTLTLVNIIVVGILAATLLGAGLFVAMDKGYDSGRPMIWLSYLSPLLLPVFVFLGRAILILLLRLGSAKFGAVYGLVSTVGVLACASLIVYLTYILTSVSGLG